MSPQRSVKNTVMHGYVYEESLESTRDSENDAHTSITVWRSPTQHAPSGGDWCEIIRISPEIIALIIGDVEGHGNAVAAPKALIRSEMMRLMTYAQTPAMILSRVNTYIHALRNNLTATALVAFYHVRTRILTFANAGHPSPLLVDAENFSFLTYSKADVPLGVVVRQTLKDRSVVIPLPGLVVLYTDGITEKNRDIVQGEQELIKAVQRMQRQDLPQTAGTIAEHIFRDTPHLDDAAVMVLCTNPHM